MTRVTITCAAEDCEKRVSGPPSVMARRRFCSRPCSNRQQVRRDASQRDRLLRLRYGLSPADYAAMVEAQGNLCAICDAEMGDGGRRHVDHDHVTGAVRGLLCAGCNTALGRIERVGIAAFAAYLDRSAVPA